MQLQLVHLRGAQPRSAGLRRRGRLAAGLARRGKGISSNIEATRLRAEELAADGIEIVEFPYYDPTATAETFRKAVGSMKVALDSPAPGLDGPMLDGDFDRLRWQLTEAEMQRYRALAGDTVAAVESVARAVQPGQSENQLAGMIAAELGKRNCGFWVLLVGADDRIFNFRHPLPTDKPVDKYFMLIACAERDGLIVSCTRLASFEPISDELHAKHRAVANVDAALISTTRPGASSATSTLKVRPPTRPKDSQASGNYTIRAGRADTCPGTS